MFLQIEKKWYDKECEGEGSQERSLEILVGVLKQIAITLIGYFSHEGTTLGLGIFSHLICSTGDFS